MSKYTCFVFNFKEFYLSIKVHTNRMEFAVKPILEITELNQLIAENRKLRIVIPQFKLNEGEKVLLRGPSGIGKSTFLNLVYGFIPVQSGNIRVLETNIANASLNQLTSLWETSLSLVSQKLNLISFLKPSENLEVSQSQSFVPDEAKKLLKFLDLDEVLESKVETLSQGEWQRLSVARAIIKRPKLLLADEPTSNLDDVNSARVVQLLMGKQKDFQFNPALLAVSHDRRLDNYFDRIINFQDFVK